MIIKTIYDRINLRLPFTFWDHRRFWNIDINIVNTISRIYMAFVFASVIFMTWYLVCN